MNEITNQKVHYFRNSRTLEIFFVTNKQKYKIFFLYNYEGKYYSLFDNRHEVRKFFNGEESEYLSFEKDAKVDSYLLKFKL